MHLYRIENIKLKDLLVVARDHDDAANILSHAMVTGMHHRPDADFDVLYIDIKKLRRAPPAEWVAECPRGIIWSVDDGAGWELVGTQMGEPTTS